MSRPGRSSLRSLPPLLPSPKQARVHEGHFPLGDGAPIVLGNTAVRIQADGALLDHRGNVAGRVSLFLFDDPNALKKQGQNLYRAPEDVEATPTPATLEPEALEQSNVQPLRELATLVILQRAFDASMQTLESSDELSQRLIQEVSN